MESNSTKNFFETMMDSQKQFVETMNQTTENLNKKFNVNTNNDYFKKWFDNQMSFFNNKKEEQGSNSNNPFEFYTNLFQNQLKGGQEMASFVNNAMSNWTTWTQNMNNFNQNSNNMNGAFQNWTKMLNDTYQNMLSNFGTNGNGKDAFMGLFNTSEMYMKMFDFMMPMFKSIQDKTFTPETFKEMFNAEKYKGMMDNMFQLNPEIQNQMKEFYTNAIKNNMSMGKDSYDQMKKQLENMPKFGTDAFSKLTEQYQSFNGNMNEALSPFVKMMSPGKDKEQMLALNELGNKMVAYQINEAQFRYMLYTTGLKAMETLSENLYSKIQNGEEVKDFNAFYNEWLNVNDTVYGELFSSEEYSKFQSEFTETVMLVKSGISKQMEKMMENVPVITRTEMDDLYKTVYEMKKHIRSLEKQLENNSVANSSKEEKPAGKASKK